jgi:hypothetical protein
LDLCPCWIFETVWIMVDNALIFLILQYSDVLNTSDLKLHCPEGILVFKCPDEGLWDCIYSVLPFYRPFGQDQVSLSI